MMKTKPAKVLPTGKRKTFKKTPIFIFLAVFALGAITCSKQKRFKSITFEGVCYHSVASQIPEEGVSVILSACATTFGEVKESCSDNQFQIGTAVTDASGHFIIKAKAARSGFYFVRYGKNNYGGEVNAGHGMDEGQLKKNSTIYVYY
jgi:hypothetical protein